MMHSTIYLDAPTQPQPKGWLIVFAIINSLIMAAISLSPVVLPAEWQAKLYLITAMTVHFVMLSLALSLAIYLINILVRAAAWRKGLCILLFSAAQLIVITNLKVYALYHFHLNGMVVNLLLGGALLENLAFSWIMWGSIAGLVVGVIIAQWIILKISQVLARSIQLKTGRTIGLSIAAIVSLQLVNGFADALAWHQVIAQNRYIPWMQTTTMRSSLTRLGFDVVEKNSSNLPKGLAGLAYPHQTLQCSTAAPMNLVMLVVDSMRADLLSPEVTPNLYALKSEAINFENHYSTSNSTRYGMFSLMYGLSPNYWSPILAEERGSLLFDQTIQHQYQHFIYGSSKLTFPEFDRTIFSRLRDKLTKGSTKSSATNDQEITQRFLKDLDNLNSAAPFFGFLFYDAPHAFSLPKGYQSPFQPILDQVNYMELSNDYDGTAFFNRYKATTHYVDSLMVQVIDKLRSKNLLQNTIVIITSDHGQEFNENKNNYWGHNSNFSIWQTKVPLLILWPNRPSMNVTDVSSHEDLLPTLLSDAFGCTTPIESYSTGMHLLKPRNNERAILMENWTDRAIFYQNIHYIIDPIGNIDAVDARYKPIDDIDLPAPVLQENLKKMSRFLKPH